MADLCGLKEVVGSDAEDKPRPISARRTRKTYFKNLWKWRDVRLNERDQNDKAQVPSIENDLTVEQRKKTKEMVYSVKEEHRKWP